MTRCVALLRGINVGQAKAVPMPELRAVFESLGHRDVVTVLRSGNVVFDAPDAACIPDAADGVDGGGGPSAAAADVLDTADLARGIERAVAATIGVTAAVLVLDAATFRAVADENPLTARASDPSRLITTFLFGTPPAGLVIPDAAALAPEELAVGRLAIYQWLPDGVLQTKLRKSFWSQFDGPLTARNARTVEKLIALIG